MIDLVMKAAFFGMLAVEKGTDRKRSETMLSGGEVDVSKMDDRWARSVFFAERDVIASVLTFERKTVQAAFPNSPSFAL